MHRFDHYYRHHRKRPTGFTLIEAIISTVIVSVMLVAVLSTLGGAARARRVHARQNLGPALARQLMTEVLATYYEEPDDPPAFGLESSESGGSRADWDDVDDYAGYSSSPPEFKDGTPVPGADGWTRQVAVQYADTQTLAGTGTATDTRLKVIIVSATAPNAEQTVIAALRAASGVHEQPPPSDTSYVTWVGVDLEIGAAGPEPTRGVNLLNHAIGGP